jgi:hypothetical protein
VILIVMDERNVSLPTIPKHVLLTGAGFSRNFGGYLAEEMWVRIFNNPLVQRSQDLKAILFRDHDYENIYERALSKPNDDPDKNAIFTAVLDSYRHMDEILRRWPYETGGQFPVSYLRLRDFLKKFSVRGGAPGFIFTLNQDLFLERHFADDLGMELPWLPTRHWNFGMNQPSLDELTLTLPEQQDLSGAIWSLPGEKLYYVKLHGSSNWKRHDGSEALVIGHSKAQSIADEPVLMRNFSLFKDTIFHPGCQLLTIGYGFGDRHINEQLAMAIMQYQLKLYILEPSGPYSFLKHLKNKFDDKLLERGLAGYFQCTLHGLLPADESTSPSWFDLERLYFGNS